MRTTTLRHVVVAAAALLALAACGPAPAPEGEAADDVPAATAPNADTMAVEAVVHRSPTCDCCGGHEAYLAEWGYANLEKLHEVDLSAWKEARGIPRELWSCHTTEIGGYLVEGHVPAETIARLLAERPAIDGIALPGMPAGSPGMGGEQDEPWIIVAFADGEAVGVFDTQ